MVVKLVKQEQLPYRFYILLIMRLVEVTSQQGFVKSVPDDRKNGITYKSREACLEFSIMTSVLSELNRRDAGIRIRHKNKNLDGV